MIKLSIVLIALMLSFASVNAQSDRQATVEQELGGMVRTWDNAFVKGDTAILGHLLADEFAFVGGPTKAEYLASFKTPPTD